MANKYTNIFSTKPVSTYRPLPIEHFSNLSQQIRQRYDLQKAQDARTRMALRKAQSMFTTPELQEGASNILQNNIARLDDLAANSNPEDTLIETQMIAEDTASSLASLQQAEQSKLADLEAIREAAEENNLSFEEAMALYEGGIEYDPNTMTASYTGRRPSYAKRMNAGEIITQIGSPKTNQTFRTTEDGRTVLVEGVTETDAAIVARDALELNPEWQQSQRQDMQIYAAQARQAEGGPQEKLDEYINSLPAASKADAMERVAERKADGYEADAIYADLRASEKTARALGFAANRFAFTSLTPREGSGSGGATSSAFDALMNQLPAGQPVRELKEAYSDMRMRFQRDSEFIKELYGRYMPAEAAFDRWVRDIADKPIEELASDKGIKSMYGNSLEILVNENERQEGESDDEYKNRIEQRYHEARQVLSSANDVINPLDPDDVRGTGSLQEQLFGNPADPRDLGMATELTYMVTTPGEEVQSLSADQLADKLGFASAAELFDNMKAVGEFSEQSGLTGWEMRVSKEGGFFSGSGKTYSIKGIVDAAGEEYRAMQLSKINQMKLDIGYNDPLEIPISLDGQVGNVVIKPENIYVDEEGNQTSIGGPNHRFVGRRIGITTKNGTYYEGDPRYDAIIEAIK